LQAYSKTLNMCDTEWWRYLGKGGGVGMEGGASGSEKEG
jgi:hypothetical protein